jgi:glycosyltransferase involved in cell wall biosynthesis
MKILHVTDAYLPKQGGIEVQVRDLATRQIEAGHRVEVMTCAPPPGAARWWTWTAGARPHPDPPAVPAEAGPLVHRTGVPWPHVARSAAMLAHLLRESRPDVVHVHLSVLSPLGILAVRTAARQRVPVVVTLHSLWWWATALYRAADRLRGWGSWPVAWTAVSDLAAEPLRLILRERAEVTLMPNGVDPLDWATEPLAREDSEVVVVSVMRLALRKRPRALLNVVRQVRSRLPEGVGLRVVVVGDGPQRRALTRRIRRYGLTDCVELVGRLDHEAIRQLYRRADLYLAPATLESFGIAALEARCAGLPVVARRRTGIADFVVQGRHGLLADSDQGLVEAVLTLARSPQLRAEMAARNRAVGPQTGWAEVLQHCALAYKMAAELALPEPPGSA